MAQQQQQLKSMRCLLYLCCCSAQRICLIWTAQRKIMAYNNNNTLRRIWFDNAHRCKETSQRHQNNNIRLAGWHYATSCHVNIDSNIRMYLTYNNNTLVVRVHRCGPYIENIFAEFFVVVGSGTPYICWLTYRHFKRMLYVLGASHNINDYY